MVRLGRAVVALGGRIARLCPAWGSIWWACSRSGRGVVLPLVRRRLDLPQGRCIIINSVSWFGRRGVCGGVPLLPGPQATRIRRPFCGGCTLYTVGRSLSTFRAWSVRSRLHGGYRLGKRRDRLAPSIDQY